MEEALVFACEGEELVGVLARPAGEAGEIGVVIVVGGPQYRVGSHRQFVLLARHLAAHGYPCLRFDYRGMGDASGSTRSFEEVGDDIRAAVDALCVALPQLRTVVLWGLCDGASAAALYAPQDERVGGLVLANPWVRTATGEARTYLRHYYLQRLLSRDFWRKLLGGGLAVGRSLRGFGGALRQARAGAPAEDAGAALPARMAAALGCAGRPFLVVLSGRDYVAREFEQASAVNEWTALQGLEHRVAAAEADHTFSSRRDVDAVNSLTVTWLDRLSLQRGAEGAHHAV